jgi:hypothetical protein
MNDLEMVITDIGNADLYAECSENLLRTHRQEIRWQAAKSS